MKHHNKQSVKSIIEQKALTDDLFQAILEMYVHENEGMEDKIDKMQDELNEDYLICEELLDVVDDLGRGVVDLRTKIEKMKEGI